MPPLSAHSVTVPVTGGRLVVVESPVLDDGEEYEIDSAPITIGRGGQNDIAIDGDEFASARHVRFEPRRDGVWVTDLGSTNGTYVNGVRIDGARRLAAGDVVRVGETDLRFDA
jgi:pSer/pThr/pTyr-binding forkhead associated (FHA) protein